MGIEQVKFNDNIVYIERFDSSIIGLCNNCGNGESTVIGSVQMAKKADKRVRRLGRMCDKCFNHFYNLEHKKKFAYVALRIMKRK